MRGECKEAFEFDEILFVVGLSIPAFSESREVTLVRKRIERMLGGKDDNR